MNDLVREISLVRQLFNNEVKEKEKWKSVLLLVSNFFSFFFYLPLLDRNFSCLVFDFNEDFLIHLLFDLT